MGCCFFRGVEFNRTIDAAWVGLHPRTARTLDSSQRMQQPQTEHTSKPNDGV